MTEMQQKFLDALFGDEARGNPRKAMDIAGYSKATSISDVTNKLKDEISEKVKDYIVTYGPKAVFSMVDVMENPTDLGNRDKLAAAREFLDRAGFKGVDKVEVKAESPLFILPPKGE